MIIFPTFFVILAILPTITNQSLIYSTKNSIIDWSKCGMETICFCANDQSEIEEIDNAVPVEPDSFPPGESTDSVGKCNIGVQHKFFTQKTSVMQFQVTQSDPNAKLMLFQGDTEMFGCKFEAGKAKLVGDVAMINRFRMEIFEEDRSKCVDGNCICALKLDRAYKLESLLIVPFTLNKPTVKFIAKDTTPYVFKKPGDALYRKKMSTCDPYIFKDKSNALGYHILPLTNKDKDILNCKNYGSGDIAYTMKFEQSGDQQNKQEGEMKELRCVRKDPTSQTNYDFVYSLVWDEIDQTTQVSTEKDLKLVEPEKYTFFCASKVDGLCENPNSDCDPAKDPKCPHYEKGSNEKPATLTCPDKKWLIDGEYYVVDEPLVCSQDKISGTNEVAFFITPPSSPERKVERQSIDKFQCFTDYDCMKKSKLHFPQCDSEDITKCESILYDGATLKCKNTTIDLTILYAESKDNGTTKSLTCDRPTGMWKDETGGTIAAKSRVKCFEKKEMRVKAEAVLSNGNITAYIVLSFVVTFVVVGIVAGLVLLYKYRKKWLPGSGKRIWLKANKAWRIKECKSIVGDLMKGDSVVGFIGSFLLLDLLLDAEIDDPEVWEQIYPFLSRFVAVIVKTDHNIHHMFSRYMYLQAKKIIDKHGWISPKPTSASNHAGLMRTVATRLLGFCLSDKLNEAADILIVTGFRKLGFKGRKQYPHCGVMWAALPHVRPRPLVRKSEGRSGKPVHFNSSQFGKRLSLIAFKAKSVLTDNPIGTFGTVSQQAAYALGGSPCLTYHSIKGKINLLNKKVENGAVAMSYFLGICGSLSKNPALMIVEACDFLGPNPTSDLLEELYRVHSQLDWNAKVMELCRIVTYHGHHLDAKLLLGKLVPSMAPRPNEPNEFLTGLYTEQQAFVKAFDKQIETVRAFFAQHTDMKELKEKPVYLTTGKTGQLDSRVNTGKVTNIDAPYNPKSCGSDSTKSDGKSGATSSTGTKTNPDPAKSPEPAATPAAEAAGAAAPAAEPAAAAAPAAAAP